MKIYTDEVKKHKLTPKTAMYWMVLAEYLQGRMDQRLRIIWRQNLRRLVDDLLTSSKTPAIVW